MTGGWWSLCVGALCALTACAHQPAAPLAEPENGERDPVVEIARFRDARAVAADPAGRLYVVDAAASTVSILRSDGEMLATVGGAGTGDYSLLDPNDVDPSNGLDFFVADAGNGRIQRFSRDGEFIETVPVPVGDPEVLHGQTGRVGRPLAVAVGQGGALYAIEADRGVVLRWEGDRRLSLLLGRDSGSEETLIEPVDMALAPDGVLYVADRARGAVMVFDAVGSFRRAIAGRPSGGVVGVALAGHPDGYRIVVVGPSSIAVHDPSAGLVDVVRPALADELVGAAVAGATLFVLTRSALFRVD